MKAPYRTSGDRSPLEIHLHFHMPWWMRALAHLRAPRFWTVLAAFVAIPAVLGAIFGLLFGLEMVIESARQGAIFGLVLWTLWTIATTLVATFRRNWSNELREVVLTPEAIFQVPLAGPSREIGYARVRSFAEDSTFVHLVVDESSFGPLAIAKRGLSAAQLEALRTWVRAGENPAR